MLPIQDKNDQLRSSRLISQLGRLKLLWTLYVMRAPFFTMYTRIPSIMGLSLLLVPISTVDRCFSTNRYDHQSWSVWSWAMHHVYKTTDHPFVIRFIPTTTVSKVPLLTSPQLLELWSVFSLTRNLYLDSPQDQVLRWHHHPRHWNIHREVRLALKTIPDLGAAREGFTRVETMGALKRKNVWQLVIFIPTCPAHQCGNRSSNGKQEEVVEMAFGMCNNQPFIWVVRPGSIIGSDG